MPEVSVVIPNYHGGRFLREAVSSVQSQTLQDWELIIVSDGCEDDLSDIEQADPRVRVFQQRNRGVSIARNVGIRYARGALVALLDDDDRMMPDRLRAQAESMSDERIGVCHTQFRLIDENGETIGAGGSKESQYGDFLRGDGAILLSSTMVRKSLVEEAGGFNPLLPLSQDLDLLYRLARESTFLFLPDILTEYRRHGSNTWANTALGGDEIKSILREHRFAAEARGEVENLRAIRFHMTRVPSDRTSLAIRRVYESRSHKNYVRMLSALGVALLNSPRFTVREGLKRARKEIAGRHSR